MSVIGSNVLAGASGSAGAAGYEIERSLRFHGADSAYLSRDFSTGNRKTWTWSGWVKRSKPSGGYYQTIFSSTASNYGLFYFNGSDSLELYNESSGSALLVSTQVFRDFSAWYHFVFRFDTTESTAANRLRVYVNGAEITSWSTDNRATLLTQNLEGIINSAIKHEIGGETTYSRYLDGYLADVHFIDGQALVATDFGQYDSNNVWQPKEYTGSYEGGLTTSQATGALPIYNTTGDFGEVKGSGTRSDSSSSTIELAVAMDGASGGTTFTDEHATIKGSGSAVALTANGNVQTITSESKFYGSSASFDGSGDYLSFTNIDLQRSSFTYEAWVYGTDTGRTLPTVIFTAGFSSGVIHSFGLADSSGAIDAVFGASTRPSSGNYYFQAPAISINKWNHIAWVRNGTTISIYVNGVGQTLDTTNAGNTGRDEVTNVEYIGSNAANEDFSGYIQDARVYSSAKYTADFTVPGVSNSFHLDFSDATSTTTLAEDSSGQNNDWTANNFSVASGAGNDSLIDTPTNYTADSGNNGGNYCTLNPLKNQSQTLKNGNLESNGTSGRSTGTLYASSGKFYWEFTAGTSYTMSGIESSTSPQTASYPGENDQQYALYGNAGSGLLYHNGSTTSVDGFVSGDVIGVALDMDGGNLYFYKNGSAMNSGSAVATGLTGAWTANCRSGSGGFNGDTVFNFGQRPFAYTPPTGFKSLCTTNLSDTTVTTSGSYTGNSNADGPFVYLNGVPTAMTIGGSAVTFGTDIDRLSNGFKITSATTNNTSGTSYSYSVTTAGDPFKTARAQAN